MQYCSTNSSLEKKTKNKNKTTTKKTLHILLLFHIKSGSQTWHLNGILDVTFSKHANFMYTKTVYMDIKNTKMEMSTIKAKYTLLDSFTNMKLIISHKLSGRHTSSSRHFPFICAITEQCMKSRKICYHQTALQNGSQNTQETVMDIHLAMVGGKLIW